MTEFIKRAATAAIALVCFIGAQPASAAGPKTQTAVLAGGCFWGMEAVFESLRGVTNVVSGYAGGSALTAHYPVVSTGLTGHAESVQISFDPKQISYADLLRVYFTVAHDPTERDRQGPDDGPQYRSSIFYANDGQRRIAEAAIRDLTRTHRFRAPIVTAVVPLRGFFAAEAYHQHFAEHNPDNPYIAQYDVPKLADLRRTYPGMLKANALTAYAQVRR